LCCKAAALGDPTVSGKAAAARDELAASLLQAKEVNEALRQRYAGNNEGAGSGGGSDYRGGDGGVGGGRRGFVDVDYAEDEVLAAMEAARAARRKEEGMDEGFDKGTEEGEDQGEDETREDAGGDEEYFEVEGW